MDVAGTDPVSGIDHDVMTHVVYTFFPKTDRYFSPLGILHYKLNPQYIKIKDGTEYIFTGSAPEYLGLPQIVEQIDGSLAFTTPDDDVMVDEGWFKEYYNTMTVEVDEDKQVFCKIRHGKMQESGKEQEIQEFMKDSYISSAKTNEKFREQFSKEMRNSFKHRRLIFNKDYEKAPLCTISDDNTSLDLVFCVPVPVGSCEDIKERFFCRLEEETWPLKSNKQLEYLLANHLYAIPKPDAMIEPGDLRWRLSFSVIEIELARSLNVTQRKCFRVLKAIIKFIVNEGLQETEKFPSYFLKTLMFWSCESNSGESLRMQNLGRQWHKLVDDVIECLEKKQLPHYFVPSYNLLDDKPKSTVNIWIERFKQIRQKPLETFIKFWSKYYICDGYTVWGPNTVSVLEILQKTYMRLLELEQDNNANQKEWYDCIEGITTNTSVLVLLTAKHFLSCYALADFLKLVDLFPQLEEMVSLVEVPYMNTDEQIIWTYYSLMMLMSTAPEQMVWTQIAEVTHHIVRKYGDNVPDKALFSVETTEKFHLTSLSMQSIRSQDGLQKKIKYVTFLIAELQYEDAVKILMTHRVSMNLGVCFSRVTSEVLDPCLKIEVSLQDEINHSHAYFSYHLLLCCYIKAGILAEVFIPEGIEIPRNNIFTEILLGYQFILSDKLLKAFHCFVDIPENSFQPYGVKYASLMYIVARIHEKWEF